MAARRPRAQRRQGQRPDRTFGGRPTAVRNERARGVRGRVRTEYYGDAEPGGRRK